MGFERFDIQLDSSVAVFFPGQIVSGKVRIWNATSEKSFKGKESILTTQISQNYRFFLM